MGYYKILTEDELKQWLNSHKKWDYVGDEIQRQFIFTDFVQAYAFISKLALSMETQNHHARIENLYNRITVGLNTHSANSQITTSDIKLAETIESIK